jgi:hypothetical protein
MSVTSVHQTKLSFPFVLFCAYANEERISWWVDTLIEIEVTLDLPPLELMVYQNITSQLNLGYV